MDFKTPRVHSAPRRALCALLAAAFLALASTAALADATDDFRKLIADATKLANEGEYDGAISKYLEAKTIFDDPLLDYNIARCYQKMDNCEVAARYYKIVVDSPKAKQEDREAASGFLAELGDCKKVEEVIVVDKGGDGGGDGGGGDGGVGGGGGEQGGGDGLGVVGLGAAITGGALILGGLAVDVGSAGLIDDFKAAAASGDREAFDQIAEDIDGRQSAVLALYGVGGAVAVAGVVLMLLDDSGEAPAVGLAPLLAPGLGGAALQGRW